MTTWLTRLTLGAAGVIALGIGATIALDPSTFYASYGIKLAASPDLLSELRAPGMNLAALGALILAGAIRSGMARTAAMLGATVFLAYAGGRVIGILCDGMPSEMIFTAMLIELVIGGACLGVLFRSDARLSARVRQPG